MQLFHFVETVSPTSSRKWTIMDHALLWMREVTGAPHRTQICVKGSVGEAESTVFIVDRSIEDLISSKF